jgi:high-affinity nickel-transport protein
MRVLVIHGRLRHNKAGFVIVGVFVITWTVALAVWHFGKIGQKRETRQAVTADTHN